MTNPQTVYQQYKIRAYSFMSAYLAVNIAAIFGAFDDARGPGAWALGLIVSAPVIGHIWATLAYMRDSDEFIRGLMVRRFIAAAGIAMAVASAWGFLESYAHAVHAPCWLIYPLFWAAFGLVSPFIQSTRP